jgi:hypothetical protein
VTGDDIKVLQANGMLLVNHCPRHKLILCQHSLVLEKSIQKQVTCNECNLRVNQHHYLTSGTSDIKSVCRFQRRPFSQCAQFQLRYGRTQPPRHEFTSSRETGKANPISDIDTVGDHVQIKIKLTALQQ